MLAPALIGAGVLGAGRLLAAEAEIAPRRGRGAVLCDGARTTKTITAVNEHGEIETAASDRLKLAGIRLPDSLAAGREWLATHVGQAAEIVTLKQDQDRWGRVPAIVFALGETGAVDLARNLVAAGLALVDAGDADRLCQPELLAVEARARKAGLGLWREDRYKPIPADDVERLRAFVGRFALVEGRVRSVGERARRTYLNFGSDWNSDLTITIPQPTWQSMRERGVTAAALRGRRVRARGIVEEWGGPSIAIFAPESLEILDGTEPRRGK